MNRKVLLIEPGYKSKFPPLGLMKISTYHKMLGDEVWFFKGHPDDFVRLRITNRIIDNLYVVNKSTDWNNREKEVESFLRNGKKSVLDQIVRGVENPINCIDIIVRLKDYYRKKIYRNYPEWDRICVTSLFTFNLDKTIDVVNAAKFLVKDYSELLVGGVAASIIPEEIERVTGIKPVTGLLDKPGVLDAENSIIIDELSPDYSVLDEVEYNYSGKDAFYCCSTRGCVRGCSFCAVKYLEPDFRNYISVSDKIEDTRLRFGDRQNLIMMDNNILASCCLEQIIDELVGCGFGKGEKFQEPDRFSHYVNEIEAGRNIRGNVKALACLLRDVAGKLKGEELAFAANVLKSTGVFSHNRANRKNVIKAASLLKDICLNNKSRGIKSRRVDFNQGIDARILDEYKISQLSRLAIKPLRIAFDRLDYENNYISAVKLAEKYGIKTLSNYLLYNEDDKPFELYRRLEINVELNRDLDVSIYSFPMKYHPVTGELSQTRDYLGKYWNRKFIRAVQVILNAAKGKIGGGESFFYKAFGQNEQEFQEILYMPEAYIVYRNFFESIGYTDTWRTDYACLRGADRQLASTIIEMNCFNSIDYDNVPVAVGKLLRHYSISTEEVLKGDSCIGYMKKKWDLLATGKANKQSSVSYFCRDM